jgi:translin
MSRPTENLDGIVDNIRLDFIAQDAAREKALPLCREAIRHCSNAIRAIHRHEFEEAHKGLQNASQLIQEAESALKTCEELNNTHFVRDAQKELAEGSLLLALVTGSPCPGPQALAVDAAAYLNGLGEAATELRRYLLDNLRQGNLSRSEELLADMDDIYNIMVAVDFPDAITGGLRRTTDTVRAVLERTRSDLTLIMRQKDLENKLEKYCASSPE